MKIKCLGVFLTRGDNIRKVSFDEMKAVRKNWLPDIKHGDTVFKVYGKNINIFLEKYNTCPVVSIQKICWINELFVRLHFERCHNETYSFLYILNEWAVRRAVHLSWKCLVIFAFRRKLGIFNV